MDIQSWTYDLNETIKGRILDTMWSEPYLYIREVFPTTDEWASLIDRDAHSVDANHPHTIEDINADLL